MPRKSITGVVLFLLLLGVLTSGCGFKPLYNLNDNSLGENVINQDYKIKLASIRVEEQNKRINQKLKGNLEEILNPDHLNVPAKYLLSFKISENVFSTFTTSSGASGRNKVILNASYVLKSLDSEGIVATGNATAEDYYNVENKRFANYVMEQEIKLNLTKVLAHDMRNLLIKGLFK